MLAADIEEQRRQAARLSDDEWRAYSMTEAAKAIGVWLQANGGLEKPIRTMTLRDLEGIAEAGLARWIVLQSRRLAVNPEAAASLEWLAAD